LSDHMSVDLARNATFGTRERLELLIQRIEQLEAPRPFVLPYALAPRRKHRRSSAYWRALRLRGWFIAGTAAASTLCGVGWALHQTPAYEARTVIQAADSAGPDAARAGILENAMLRERIARKILAVRPDWQGLVDQTARGLSVQVQPGRGLVEIACHSPEPHLAAQYANMLAAEFIGQQLEAGLSAPQPAHDLFAARLYQLGSRIDDVDRELSEAPAPAPTLITAVANDELFQLQAEASRAEADRIARSVHYDLTRRVSTETLPEVLDDSAIRADVATLSDLRRQLADLNASFTPEYPQIRRIEAQMAALEDDIARRKSLIVERLRNEVTIARTTEDTLARELTSKKAAAASESDRNARYEALRSGRDNDRQLYSALEEQVQNARVSMALRSTFIVTDPATPPNKPAHRDYLGAPLGGLLAGLFGSVAIVLIRTARNPASVRRRQG
jgi:uncharacterized protein involved in exopolysaccharide biosynthesis